MRWVRALVLPEPAPATMRTGPSVCRTASCWTGFSPSSRGDGRSGVSIGGGSVRTGPTEASDATGVILPGPGDAPGSWRPPGGRRRDQVPHASGVLHVGVVTKPLQLDRARIELAELVHAHQGVVFAAGQPDAPPRRRHQSGHG